MLDAPSPPEPLQLEELGLRFVGVARAEASRAAAGEGFDHSTTERPSVEPGTIGDDVPPADVDVLPDEPSAPRA